MYKPILLGCSQLTLIAIVMLITASSSTAGVRSSGKAQESISVSQGLNVQNYNFSDTTIILPRGKASATGILVRYKVSTDTKTTVNAVIGRSNLKVEREFKNVPRLKRLVPAAGSAAKFLTKEILLARIKELQASNLFEYVEPDWKVHLLAPPTDSAFADGTLWGLENTGQNGGITGIDVNAVSAWDITTGSPNIIVGVVDSGIRYTHQDIAGNMWTNSGELPGNGTDDDFNGYIDDIYGINAINGSGDPFDDNDHGTHVAGTIAATANDSGQHVGVAYNVRLMGLKFLSAGGSGNTSDAIECIDYAVAQGANILNNSWGGGPYSQALRDSIQAANDAGVLFIAAAGNASSDNDLIPFYPSGYDVPNVVSVAAVDRGGNLANFSSFGATTVNIGAPGVDILSSTAASDASYDSFSGTSMASPHVAGVAALLASQYPNAGITELKNRLFVTAKPLGSLSGRTSTGGIVDAQAALTIASDGVLELTASVNGLAEEGQLIEFFVSVSDLLPVTGATVTGNFDGEPAQSFKDDGLSPDVSANDGLYSASLLVPIGVSTINLNVQVVAPGKNPAAEVFSFPIISHPSNDDFADRIVLASGMNQTTGTNRFASSQIGEPINPPFAAGGKTVWWEWTAAATGNATISTSGSNFDTTLAIYQGNTLSNLNPLGSNDDSGGLQSAVTFSAIAGQSYQIQVDGYAGSEGDIELNYPPTGGIVGAPVIVTQPVGSNVIVGDPFSVSVTATSDQPLAYQWSLDGAPITGATNPTYSVNVSAETDEGSYTVEISNNSGSVVSNPAFVSVDLVGLLPSNDDFSDAQALPGTSGLLEGTNVRATEEPSEPDHAGFSNPLASVWFIWTAPSNGILNLDTFGSDFDTTLAAYSGTSINSLFELASDNDSQGLQSAVSISVTANETYRIAVDGFLSNEGQVILNYIFLPSGGSQPNDNFADRIDLSGSTTSTGSNIGASGESGEPSHAGNSVPLASVWWSWTAQANGSMTISTEGSNFDTTLATYTGNSVDTLSEVASNDDFFGFGLSSQVTFMVSQGITYSIAVDGYGPSEGNIEVTITDSFLDSDNDTVPDSSDNCPNLANADQNDLDGDNIGDACDPDDDNDSVPDASDNCPTLVNTDQADLDGDSLGDACDPVNNTNTGPAPTNSGGGGGSLTLASLVYLIFGIFLRKKRRAFSLVRPK